MKERKISCTNHLVVLNYSQNNGLRGVGSMYQEQTKTFHCDICKKQIQAYEVC
ncbi:hypothetical protein RT42_GL000961 [Enterococcus cecorum DSM 20682 = ATCC 43198]|nr:hypothetical protein RT42_GL000961 [Enterococcus cecorum DSM 20682 = ATCC 43198]